MELQTFSNGKIYEAIALIQKNNQAVVRCQQAMRCVVSAQRYPSVLNTTRSMSSSRPG